MGDVLMVPLEPWHWIAIGLVLAGLEMILPTTVFLWFGVSGVVTGLVLMVFPLGLAFQFVLFAGLALASYVPIRYLARRNRDESQAGQFLNRRGRSYVGHHVTLVEAVQNGYGAAKVDDTRWRVECETDLPAGTTVVVVDVDGATLKVRPLDG